MKKREIMISIGMKFSLLEEHDRGLVIRLRKARTVLLKNADILADESLLADAVEAIEQLAAITRRAKACADRSS